MSDPVASHAFAVAAARDAARAALLRAFLASGLLFMLVPGTLLGVLNLLQISGRQSVALVSSAWIEAHGHAQVFGWIGSFMIGIGVYSVPSVNLPRRALGLGWTAWAVWTAGVAGRWIASVYSWQWRLLLPLSAICELVAFLLFLFIVSGHRFDRSSGPGAPGSRAWIAVVMAGALGWVVTLVLNLMTAVALSRSAATPDVPHAWDQNLLVLLMWGVLAPFIWGFSARWLPVLLALPRLRVAALLAALVVDAAGILFAFAGNDAAATTFAFGAAAMAIIGLRIFARSRGEPRTRGVHVRFPLFVRLAYVWLLVAAALGIAAAQWDVAGGLWGASRHAFTVGFTAAMVLAVGQRMLPGFAAHRTLWSPRLMGWSLGLLMVGCLIRVSLEVVAYERDAAWAWSVLPVSGFIELGALMTFAVNLYWTLWV